MAATLGVSEHRTPAGVAERVDQLFAVLGEVAERITHIERLLELLPVLLSAHGDPTHVTIPQAAKILHVSERTVRRKIARGELRLDVMVGTKITGIATVQLYGKWISLDASRRAVQRELQHRESDDHRNGEK